jgi:microcystin-dependent protein
MSSPFVGEIKMFAGNFAPKGYALCNGQLLSISQNTALFSLLGTFYGGNGTSNFGLPNFQGIAPVHQGQGAGLSPYPLGETLGVPSVTLQTTQIASHNHPVNAINSGGTLVPATNAFWAEDGATRGAKAYSATAGATMNAAAFLGPATAAVPHNNLSPYLVVNFIIALVGIYPARN